MEDHVKYVNANYHQLKDDGTTLGIQLITCRPKHHKELTYPQYNCVGRFQELRLLSHQCISHYLEILPSKHNETYILSEAYKDTIYSQALHIEEKQISRLLQDVIEGIEYIHNHGMVVGIIDPKYIYITKKQNAKIGNYALYHLSKENFLFTSFYPAPTIAPEVAKTKKHLCTKESDVFGIGMIALMLYAKKIPRNNQYISFLIALSNVVVHTDSCECCPTTLCDEFTTIVKSLIKEYLEIECDVPPQLLRCLQPNPAFRPTITELLNLKIFGHKREEIQPESLEFPELLNFSYNAPGCQMTRREILHEMCYLKQLTVDIPKQHTEILGGVFGEMAKYPIFSIERFVSISRDLSTEEVHNDFCIYSLDVNDVITASEEVDCEIDKYITTDDTTIDQPTSDKLPFIVNILAQQITSSSKSDCIRYHRIHHAYFRFLARYAARNPLTVGTVVRRVERVVQSYIPEFLRLPVWMLFLGIDVNAAYDHYKTRSKDVPQCIGSDDIDEETRVIVEDVKRAFSTVPIIANEKTRAMLTRVLFSFYKSGEEYCQGIHSVCAVFLSLSFNEAICSECLHKFEADFVRQYSPENFRIYFIRLCQLLSFHGPRVSPVMSAKIIENSTAIRWFLPLLSLSMKLNSLYQLWDWVLQSPKFAKFMYFLLAYILSCENLILEFTDPFELILYFNKVEFGSTTTNEQCISQFKSLIQTSPISYTENHISPSHPSRSVSYTTLADQAIDESSMVLVPLLDQSDLTFTMYNTTSLYIDMRPEAPYSPLAPKSLRVIFHTTEEVVSDVSTSLNSFETYPAFVVLISDWKSEEERSAVYLEMMLVADGLVKGGFSHVCMSAVAFQDLDRQFFNNGEKPTEQEDDVV